MMHISVFIQPEVADAIKDVIIELSTELDLNYENDDLVVAGETIKKMERLVAMLISAGHSAPAEYTHVVERYHKAIN